MKQFLIQLISDQHNRISHARFLNLLIGVCACLFCWKLILTDEFTTTYFLMLLVYGSGQQTVNKFLDLKLGTKSNPEPDAEPTKSV